MVKKGRIITERAPIKATFSWKLAANHSGGRKGAPQFFEGSLYVTNASLKKIEDVTVSIVFGKLVRALNSSLTVKEGDKCRQWDPLTEWKLGDFGAWERKEENFMWPYAKKQKIDFNKFKYALSSGKLFSITLRPLGLEKEPCRLIPYFFRSHDSRLEL